MTCSADHLHPERYRSGRNGGASKASCRVTGTWVRIPPSPPDFARAVARASSRPGLRPGRAKRPSNAWSLTITTSASFPRNGPAPSQSGVSSFRSKATRLSRSSSVGRGCGRKSSRLRTGRRSLIVGSPLLRPSISKRDKWKKSLQASRVWIAARRVRGTLSGGE